MHANESSPPLLGKSADSTLADAPRPSLLSLSSSLSTCFPSLNTSPPRLHSRSTKQCNNLFHTGMALRAPVPSGGQQKQAKASLLLSELNALIATNEPAQRSRVREAFNEALTTFFDLGTDVVNHLDGVPVVSEWLPPVKVIFWLGVVFCHRRDARDACRDFGRLLGDGYSVAVQLDLGEHSYARKVLDECVLTS